MAGDECGTAGSGGRRGIVGYGQDEIAKQINQVSDLVRDATGKLDPETPVSRIAGQVADTLSGAGRYIAGADPGRLAEDARQFAHRRPELFLGGAFLSGLVLGRFLRSRPPEATREEERPTGEEQMSEQEVSHGG